LWACGFALLLPEFGPLLALGDAGVYGGFDDGFLDAAGGFDAAAFVVDAVGCDGLGAVFVLGYGVLGEGELRALVFFFSPVGAAVRLGVSGRSCETVKISKYYSRSAAEARGGLRNAYPAGRDMLAMSVGLCGGVVVCGWPGRRVR
jgi:hypothetical protein